LKTWKNLHSAVDRTVPSDPDPCGIVFGSY
jgi:hypothetical protein